MDFADKYLKSFSASNNTGNIKIKKIRNTFKQVSVFVSSQKPNVFSIAEQEKDLFSLSFLSLHKMVVKRVMHLCLLQG